MFVFPCVFIVLCRQGSCDKQSHCSATKCLQRLRNLGNGRSWALLVCSIIKIVLKFCFVYQFFFCSVMDSDCSNEFHIIQQRFLEREVRKQLQFWTKKTAANAICQLASSSVNSPALQRGSLIVLLSIGVYDVWFHKGSSQHGPLLISAGM